MLLETITETVYHKNGNLSYKSIIGIVNQDFLKDYENYERTNLHINAVTGLHYVKLLCEKFHNNNQLAWRLEWNDKGELSNPDDKQYRKDGTIITEI